MDYIYMQPCIHFARFVSMNLTLNGDAFTWVCRSRQQAESWKSPMSSSMCVYLCVVDVCPSEVVLLPHLHTIFSLPVNPTWIQSDNLGLGLGAWDLPFYFQVGVMLTFLTRLINWLSLSWVHFRYSAYELDLKSTQPILFKPINLTWSQPNQFYCTKTCQPNLTQHIN